MKVILTASFVTEKNLAELMNEYRAGILSSKIETPAVFEVGKVIVTMTIKYIDLFDETIGLVHKESWLATREEFDARFNIVDEVEALNGETFTIVTRK